MGGFLGYADATAQKVEYLKREIKIICDRHQHVTDKAKKLSQDLKKLDLKAVNESLNSMNQNITQNLKTILADQQSKLHTLETIDVGRVAEDPNTMLNWLMKALQLISTVFSFLGLAFASNPVTMALDILLIAFSSIMNVFNFFNNLQAIEQLTKKKEQLQEYFQWGGKFEQDVKSICDASYQMVENFYMFVISFVSMLHQLQININLMAISENQFKIDYKYCSHMLKLNPFDPDFVELCRKTYEKFISIQGQHWEEKVNISCKYLEEFEAVAGLTSRIQIVKDICTVFSKDSSIGKQMLKCSGQFKKLATIRDQYQNKFQKRLKMDKKDLPSYDKDLFDDLLDQFRKLQKPQINAIELVSFFTTTFYADDPSGNTLRERDLKELFELTESLSYLGVNSSKQNIIYLPTSLFLTDRFGPTSEQGYWRKTRSCLKEKYAEEHKISLDDFQVSRMYMKMQLGPFFVGSQQKTKLNFFYGLALTRKNSQVKQYYEKQASLVTQHQQITVHVRPREIVTQHIEEQDEDLKQLCGFMTFYINTVAYPERVLKFNISRHGSKYKAILAWKSQNVKQEYFGKIVKYNIHNLSDYKQKQSEMKKGIFYEECFKEEGILARFSFK